MLHCQPQVFWSKLFHYGLSGLSCCCALGLRGLGDYSFGFCRVLFYFATALLLFLLSSAPALAFTPNSIDPPARGNCAPRRSFRFRAFSPFGREQQTRGAAWASAVPAEQNTCVLGIMLYACISASDEWKKTRIQTFRSR